MIKDEVDNVAKDVFHDEVEQDFDNMVKDDVEGSKMGRQGPRGVKGDVWGHQVGLTSLLIIQEVYFRLFRLSLRAGGRTGGSIRGITRGPCGPKNSKNILFYFDY